MNKAQQALQIAQEIAKRSKSAIDMHNAFFGAGGKYGQLFPTLEETFAQTAEYREILRLRSQLAKSEDPVAWPE